MNQDQKKYFRERIQSIVKSKKVGLKKDHVLLPNVEIEDYLSEKNFKPNVKELLKVSIGTMYNNKAYFDNPSVNLFFDLTEYNKAVERVKVVNEQREKTLNAICEKIDSDSSTVIDAVMFADEVEALKQLKLFTEKEYK